MVQSDLREDPADNGLLITRFGGTSHTARHKLVLKTFDGPTIPAAS